MPWHTSALGQRARCAAGFGGFCVELPGLAVTGQPSVIPLATGVLNSRDLEGHAGTELVF